jgi:hypothetical protein
MQKGCCGGSFLCLKLLRAGPLQAAPLGKGCASRPIGRPLPGGAALEWVRRSAQGLLWGVMRWRSQAPLDAGCWGLRSLSSHLETARW